MSPNQILVRNMVVVATTIAAITTVALVFAQPSPAPRHVRDEAMHPNAAGEPPPLERLGARLYERKGCIGCHSIDGGSRIGPTFLHDYGQTITLASGITLRVDETYLRESILHAQAQARPGYPPSMPAFEGELKEREVEALIAFIRSLQ